MMSEPAAAAPSAAVQGPHPSIDIDRVVEPGTLDVKCTVCTCLSFNTMGWASCSHLVCGDCFSRMAHKICPLCRSPAGAGSGPVASRQHSIDHMVARLQVRCGYPGCTAVYHLRDTEWVGERRHEAACDFKPITCLHCAKDMPRGEMANHQADLCPQRVHTCGICDQEVSHLLIADHWTADGGCVGLVECPNGCRPGDADTRVEGRDHTKRRKVQAAASSAAAAASSAVPVRPHVNLIRQPDMAAHLADACPRRLVACGMCDAHVAARHMELHMADSSMMGVHFRSLSGMLAQIRAAPSAAVQAAGRPSAFGASVFSGIFVIDVDDLSAGTMKQNQSFVEPGNVWNSFRIMIEAVHCTTTRQPGKVQLVLTFCPIRGDEIGLRGFAEQYRAKVSLLQVHQLEDPLESMDSRTGFNHARRAFTTKIDFSSTRTNDVIRIGEIPQDMFDEQNQLLLSPHGEFGVHVELFRRT